MYLYIIFISITFIYLLVGFFIEIIISTDYYLDDLQFFLGEYCNPLIFIFIFIFKCSFFFFFIYLFKKHIIFFFKYFLFKINKMKFLLYIFFLKLLNKNLNSLKLYRSRSIIEIIYLKILKLNFNRNLSINKNSIDVLRFYFTKFYFYSNFFKIINNLDIKKFYFKSKRICNYNLFTFNKKTIKPISFISRNYRYWGYPECYCYWGDESYFEISNFRWGVPHSWKVAADEYLLYSLLVKWEMIEEEMIETRIMSRWSIYFHEKEYHHNFNFHSRTQEFSRNFQQKFPNDFAYSTGLHRTVDTIDTTSFFFPLDFSRQKIRQYFNCVYFEFSKKMRQYVHKTDIDVNNCLSFNPIKSVKINFKNLIQIEFEDLILNTQFSIFKKKHHVNDAFVLRCLQLNDFSIGPYSKVNNSQKYGSFFMKKKKWSKHDFFLLKKRVISILKLFFRKIVPDYSFKDHNSIFINYDLLKWYLRFDPNCDTLSDDKWICGQVGLNYSVQTIWKLYRNYVVLLRDKLYGAKYFSNDEIYLEEEIIQYYRRLMEWSKVWTIVTGTRYSLFELVDDLCLYDDFFQLHKKVMVDLSLYNRVVLYRSFRFFLWRNFPSSFRSNRKRKAHFNFFNKAIHLFGFFKLYLSVEENSLSAVLGLKERISWYGGYTPALDKYMPFVGTRHRVVRHAASPKKYKFGKFLKYSKKAWAILMPKYNLWLEYYYVESAVEIDIWRESKGTYLERYFGPGEKFFNGKQFMEWWTKVSNLDTTYWDYDYWLFHWTSYNSFRESYRGKRRLLNTRFEYLFDKYSIKEAVDISYEDIWELSPKKNLIQYNSPEKATILSDYREIQLPWRDSYIAYVLYVPLVFWVHFWNLNVGFDYFKDPGFIDSISSWEIFKSRKYLFSNKWFNLHESYFTSWSDESGPTEQYCWNNYSNTSINIFTNDYYSFNIKYSENSTLGILDLLYHNYLENNYFKMAKINILETVPSYNPAYNFFSSHPWVAYNPIICNKNYLYNWMSDIFFNKENFNFFLFWRSHIQKESFSNIYSLILSNLLKIEKNNILDSITIYIGNPDRFVNQFHLNVMYNLLQKNYFLFLNKLNFDIYSSIYSWIYFNLELSINFYKELIFNLWNSIYNLNSIKEKEVYQNNHGLDLSYLDSEDFFLWDSSNYLDSFPSRWKTLKSNVNIVFKDGEFLEIKKDIVPNINIKNNDLVWFIEGILDVFDKLFPLFNSRSILDSLTSSYAWPFQKAYNSFDFIINSDNSKIKIDKGLNLNRLNLNRLNLNRFNLIDILSRYDSMTDKKNFKPGFYESKIYFFFGDKIYFEVSEFLPMQKWNISDYEDFLKYIKKEGKIGFWKIWQDKDLISSGKFKNKPWANYVTKFRIKPSVPSDLVFKKYYNFVYPNTLDRWIDIPLFYYEHFKWLSHKGVDYPEKNWTVKEWKNFYKKELGPTFLTNYEKLKSQNNYKDLIPPLWLGEHDKAFKELSKDLAGKNLSKKLDEVFLIYDDPSKFERNHPTNRTLNTYHNFSMGYSLNARNEFNSSFPELVVSTGIDTKNEIALLAKELKVHILMDRYLTSQLRLTNHDVTDLIQNFKFKKHKYFKEYLVGLRDDLLTKKFFHNQEERLRAIKDTQVVSTQSTYGNPSTSNIFANYDSFLKSRKNRRRPTSAEIVKIGHLLSHYNIDFSKEELYYSYLEKSLIQKDNGQIDYYFIDKADNLYNLDKLKDLLYRVKTQKDIDNTITDFPLNQGLTGTGSKTTPFRTHIRNYNWMIEYMNKFIKKVDPEEDGGILLEKDYNYMNEWRNVNNSISNQYYDYTIKPIYKKKN